MFNATTPPQPTNRLESDKEVAQKLIDCLQPIANLAETTSISDNDSAQPPLEFRTLVESLDEVVVYRDMVEDRYIVRVSGFPKVTEELMATFTHGAKRLSKFFRRERRIESDPLLEAFPDLRSVRIGFAYFPRACDGEFSMEFIINTAFKPFRFKEGGGKQPINQEAANDILSDLTDYYLKWLNDLITEMKTSPSVLYGGASDGIAAKVRFEKLTGTTAPAF